MKLGALPDLSWAEHCIGTTGVACVKRPLENARSGERTKVSQGRAGGVEWGTWSEHYPCDWIR